MDFIKDYIIYNAEINSTKVLKQFASKQTHQIIVSHVTNPCRIQVQLAENYNALSLLMEDLEKFYCGIGASDYDMPDEFIELNHLCAAVFPTSNFFWLIVFQVLINND